MDRIVLCGMPYSGKTTLRYALGKRGYTVIDFGHYLRVLLAKAVAVTASKSIDEALAEVENNKARYRVLLQEFGKAIEFGDNPQYIQDCLSPLGSFTHGKIVFDCVRTEGQWRFLETQGFQLVRVTIDPYTQASRAKSFGVTYPELEALLRNPLERGIPDVPARATVDGAAPVTGVADMLINL